MPYQAEKDATIPKVIATGVDDRGEATATYESITYATGAVIFETDIAPHVLSRLEDGSDDRLSAMLRFVDESEARRILAEQAGEEIPESQDQIRDQNERLTESPSIEPQAPTAEPTYEPEAPQEPEAPAEVAASEPPQEDPEVATSEPETTEEGSDEAPTESEAASTEEPSGTEGEQPQEDSSPPDETAAAEQPAEPNLDEMSKRDLNKIARDLDIEGRSKMDEDELRTAIKAKQG